MTEVSIEFDVPQMFKKTAHHRTIPLDPVGITRLLESESNGVFDYTVNGVTGRKAGHPAFGTLGADQ